MSTAADLLAEADALDEAWDERARREAPLRMFVDILNNYVSAVARQTGARIKWVSVPGPLAREIGAPCDVATPVGPVRIEVDPP